MALDPTLATLDPGTATLNSRPKPANLDPEPDLTSRSETLDPKLPTLCSGPGTLNLKTANLDCEFQAMSRINLVAPLLVIQQDLSQNQT